MDSYYQDPRFWWDNPWATNSASGDHGAWYINGLPYAAHEVVRRDPNYVPFQSVTMYGPYGVAGLQSDPLAGMYPQVGIGGYQSHYDWSAIRPSNALGYQPYDADGLSFVRQSSMGSYPWYSYLPFNPWLQNPEFHDGWVAGDPAGW